MTQSITYKEWMTPFSWFSSIFFYTLQWLFHLKIWHHTLLSSNSSYACTLSPLWSHHYALIMKDHCRIQYSSPKLPRVLPNTTEIPSDLSYIHYWGTIRPKLYSLFTHSPLQNTGIPRRYCGSGSRPPQLSSTIKWVTQFFSFLGAHKSYVNTVL